MSKLNVGNAPDSWGVWFPNDEKQIDWETFLDEVSDAGYTNIELGPWGYLPTDKEILKEELEKRNLNLIATTVCCNFCDQASIDQLIEELPEIASLQLTFDAKYMVLLPAMVTDLFTGEQILERTLSAAQRAELNKNVQYLSTLVKERYNIQLLVHPHADSHLETEEEIESLLAETDEDVQLCFDIGHHAYAGGDACSFLKKHATRIPYLHLKNCDQNVLSDMKRNSWPFAKAVTQGIMCEPWKGIVDFEEVQKTISEISFTGLAVVEQDMYPVAPSKPHGIAKATLQYLQKVGIAR